MLFHTNKDGTALLHDDVYKLCPEFKVLKEDIVQYIVLVYDYYSPFNQMDTSDRKKRASKLLDLKNIEDKQEIRAAIDLYVSLQFDPRRERIRTYREKIKILDVQMKNTDISPSKINQIIQGQDILDKKIAELESEIEYSMLSGELRGGRKKSLLEFMKENRKLAEMELEAEDEISVQVAFDIPSIDE